MFFSRIAILCLSIVIGGFILVGSLEAGESKLKLKKASVFLNPTQGNRVFGIVTFEEVEGGGVQIVGNVEGLTPGKHGFHIHEFGDCSAPDGSSTGGHYNPNGHFHGSPDHAERHMGDLGNIVADDTGHGHYERLDKVIQLSGAHSVIGRSLVVHSNADDYTTQPTGNSGGRVACGVILE